MASPSRTAEREEQRRLNMRTLVIASAASATAALVTSQLWIAGTWIAAAMTPVIVTLVSELLHRPTERIARGLTTDRPALSEPRRVARPDAEPPVRIYRTGEPAPRPTGRRRKVALGVVLSTAALAFLIAVVVLTVPELVTGGSIGKNSGRTTLFSGSKQDNGDKDGSTPRDTTTDEQKTETEEQQTETQEQTTTDEETTPTETVPPATTAPPATPPPTTPTPTTPPPQ